MPIDDRSILVTLPNLLDNPADTTRLTGCRPAEVCIMRPCDVDRSGDVWEYRPRSHKTDYRGRERVVFPIVGSELRLREIDFTDAS